MPHLPRFSLQLLSAAAILAPALGPAPALADAGRLEINQICAVETGCFPGDAAGFPVTLTTPGSYALTGNLSLALESPSTHAIEINTPSRLKSTVTIT